MERAERVLQEPPNVGLALRQLNRFLLQVVETAGIEGGRLTLEVAEAEGLDPDGVAEAGAELQNWGLGFPDPDGSLTLLPVVVAALRNPGGLGPPLSSLAPLHSSEDLSRVCRGVGLSGPGAPTRKAEMTRALERLFRQPEWVRRHPAAAPPQAVEALGELRRAGGRTEEVRESANWQPSYGWYSWRWRIKEREGPHWLWTHGLVLPADPDAHELRVPAEVERALRGRLFPSWERTPPPLPVGELREERHPIELVAAIEQILHALRQQPAAAVQAGGIAKRELKRLGRAGRAATRRRPVWSATSRCGPGSSRSGSSCHKRSPGRGATPEFSSPVRRRSR